MPHRRQPRRKGGRPHRFLGSISPPARASIATLLRRTVAKCNATNSASPPKVTSGRARTPSRQTKRPHPPAASNRALSTNRNSYCKAHHTHRNASCTNRFARRTSPDRSHFARRTSYDTNRFARQTPLSRASRHKHPSSRRYKTCGTHLCTHRCTRCDTFPYTHRRTHTIERLHCIVNVA